MPQASAVSLTLKQQALIDRLVRSGRFNGANDVVSTSLRLLEERENQAVAFISGIEAEIEKGLESGDAYSMETADELLSSFRRRT